MILAAAALEKPNAASSQVDGLGFNPEKRVIVDLTGDSDEDLAPPLKRAKTNSLPPNDKRSLPCGRPPPPPIQALSQANSPGGPKPTERTPWNFNSLPRSNGLPPVSRTSSKSATPVIQPPSKAATPASQKSQRKPLTFNSPSWLDKHFSVQTKPRSSSPTTKRPRLASTPTKVKAEENRRLISQVPSRRTSTAASSRRSSESERLLRSFQRRSTESSDSSVRETRPKRRTLVKLRIRPDVASIDDVPQSPDISAPFQDSITDKARLKALAPTKAKKTDRSKIHLDRGHVAAPYKTIQLADFIPASEQTRSLLHAKFEDINGPALTFVNTLNERQIHGKFQFIEDYVYKEALKHKKTTAPQNQACPCHRTSPEDLIGAYRLVKGQAVLTSQFLNYTFEVQEIRECNDDCMCDESCFNKVVQVGRTLPLEVFMTERCGFGIRSPVPIRQGQFIDVYLGELLTLKALEEYEHAVDENASSYVFSLDFFSDPAQYHVQGLHYGSPTRFINHSCNPNARIFVFMINNGDQKLYKLAYFATKDIAPRQEITFDYNPRAAAVVESPQGPESAEIASPGDELTKCLCGEPKCRGLIWPKQVQAKRRGRGGARR